MNSYQRLKQACLDKDKKIEMLQKELMAKGNVFFTERRWLGTESLTFGTVIDGKLLEITS